MRTIKDMGKEYNLVDFSGSVSSKYLIRDNLIFRCGNYVPEIQGAAVLDADEYEADLSFHDNPLIRQFLSLLDKQNYPIVIKSVTGYGQASYITAVFFMLMNVNDTVILNNAYYDGHYDSRPASLFKRLFSSSDSFIREEKNTMQKQLAELKSRYENYSSFFKTEYQLTEEQITQIRNACLEEEKAEYDLPDYTRVRIMVKGRVQGVGFRGFVTTKAENLGLTGYVENLEDGSVLIEAQGDGYDLSALLSHVKRGNSFIIVSSMEYSEIKIVPGEKRFDYRFNQYDI